MTATYTDGVEKVVVKNKYAYHYNLKTGSYMGKSDFLGNRIDFIKSLLKTGFKRDEEDYQRQLKGEQR